MGRKRRMSSPPSPSHAAGPAHLVPTPAPSSPSLKPNAAPFSPSSAASEEDLPEWLLFSPSSSEGRSSALGRISGASPATSCADVVKGKAKAPADAKDNASLG
jgi:hypothetical protein